MKKRNLLYLIMAIVLPFCYVSMSSFSSGKLGNSTTGCSGSGCHAGNLTTTALNITGIPSGGYVAGTTYSLTATITNPNYTMAAARGGFNISCTAGSFAATTGVTVNGSNDKEITHAGAKAMSSGTVSWTLSWTAPPTGGTGVIFHFVGNATNGDFGTSGDQPNYDPFPFAEATSAPAPSIASVATSNITGTECTVGAMVNANGASTGCNVEYGLTTSYGANVVASPAPVTGTTPTAITATITGLMPNTTYNYRVNAASAAGTTNGTNGTFTTGAPVAVPEFTKGQFTVFPNPASDILNIRLDQSITSYKVGVYNINGQLVSNPQVTAEDDELQINTSDIAEGVYFLHAIVNEKRIVQKITIQ